MIMSFIMTKPVMLSRSFRMINHTGTEIWTPMGDSSGESSPTKLIIPGFVYECF